MGRVVAHMKQCHQAINAEAKASYIMGIPFTISAFLTPVVGGVVDYCGGHAFITTSAAVILFGVHMTIRMSSKIPYVPLIFQGIAYSMYASALWPAIGAIVPLADKWRCLWLYDCSAKHWLGCPTDARSVLAIQLWLLQLCGSPIHWP